MIIERDRIIESAIEKEGGTMVKKNVLSRKRGSIVVVVVNSFALMVATQAMSAGDCDAADYGQESQVNEVVVVAQTVGVRGECIAMAKARAWVLGQDEQVLKQDVAQCDIGDRGRQALRIETEDENDRSAYACVRYIDGQESAAENEALLHAAEQGDVGRVSEALEAGAYIDCQNRYGNTALMLAALRGRCGVVEKLLAAKARFDVCNEHRVNALMLAVIGSHGRGVRMAEKIGYYDIIKQLTLAGARTDLKDRNGNQMRHYASSQILGLVRQQEYGESY